MHNVDATVDGLADERLAKLEQTLGDQVAFERKILGIHLSKLVCMTHHLIPLTHDLCFYHRLHAFINKNDVIVVIGRMVFDFETIDCVG